MVKLYGMEMTKKELLRHLGNIEQVAYARPGMLDSGKAFGLKTIEVTNGILDFTVLEGRCLDIFNMKYKGMNMNFITKPGLTSQLLSAQVGDESFRSLCGGMLYTCGMMNVGNACVYNGQEQAFHGRVRVTAAENVSSVCGWNGDEYEIKIRGEMREAQVFNENLVLTREISTKIGEKSIKIKNEVENVGFQKQEIMMLFHINPGFPILDKGAKLLAPVNNISPRDEASQKGIKSFNNIIDPEDGFIEQVFYIEPGSDKCGNTMAAFVNPRLNLGMYVKYNVSNLPNLVFWKSMASGDYAVGVEPSNCYPQGKIHQKEIGKLREIDSFEKLNFDLEIGVLDGKEEINSFSAKIESYS